MPESDLIKNPYPYNKPPVWVGRRYRDPASPFYRTLVLGESTYDNPPEADPEWIYYWIYKRCQLPENGEALDKTFCRLYLATSGLATSHDTWPQLYERAPCWVLEAWFNLFAIHNHIWKTIGGITDRDHIDELYVAFKPDLAKVLELVNPTYVWVLWPHPNCQIALRVLTDNGIQPEDIIIVPKWPGRQASSAELETSWQQLRERIANGLTN